MKVTIEYDDAELDKLSRPERNRAIRHTVMEAGDDAVEAAAGVSALPIRKTVAYDISLNVRPYVATYRIEAS